MGGEGSGKKRDGLLRFLETAYMEECLREEEVKLGG